MGKAMRTLWCVLLSACQTPILAVEDAPSCGAHLRITDALIDRHMAPLYRWLEATGVEPVPLDREPDYALIIKPDEPGRAPLVCIRFWLAYQRGHIRAHHWTPFEPWIFVTETPAQYAARKVEWVRLQLKERLLLAFQQDFQGPMETFTYGTAMFCRMPTGNSDPAKVRPEDIIFKE